MSSKRIGRRQHVGGPQHPGPQVGRGQGDGPRLPQASRHSGEGGDRVQFTDEFITSLKKGKGLPMEVCLASCAIGLLTITVGNGSTAKEIMEQLLPYLEKAVSSGSEALKIFALDCLATTTFVGANNWEETEKSMKSCGISSNGNWE